MFQFDSIAARAMLTTVYANGLDIYPDEFAHLIHGSAPTKAQVAEALESALSEHQAILTNELRDINGWWDRKDDQHQDDINHLGATADRAATQLITKTMGVMRQHRAILNWPIPGRLRRPSSRVQRQLARNRGRRAQAGGARRRAQSLLFQVVVPSRRGRKEKRGPPQSMRWGGFFVFGESKPGAAGRVQR